MVMIIIDKRKTDQLHLILCCCRSDERGFIVHIQNTSWFQENINIDIANLFTGKSLFLNIEAKEIMMIFTAFVPHVT